MGWKWLVFCACVAAGLVALLGFADGAESRWLPGIGNLAFDGTWLPLNLAVMCGLGVALVYLGVRKPWLHGPARLRPGAVDDDGAGVAAAFRRLFGSLAVVFALAAVLTAGAGIWNAKGWRPRATVPVAAYGQGYGRPVPEGPTRLVGGEPDRRIVVVHTRYGPGGDDRAFVRLDDGSGAGRFFVQMAAAGAGRYRVASREGILVRNGLPGVAVALYKAEGTAVPDPYYVLFVDAWASEAAAFLRAGLLAVVALVFALAMLAQSSRLRKLGRRHAVADTALPET